ncbi:MAG: ice-binding family protein [Salibacteraceae bacterium]
MKQPILTALAAFALFSISNLAIAQAPDLGSTANFVLFSTDGAVSNSGISQLTGKVGTNNGSNTGFGNVNGGMHAGDGTSAQAATDLLIAYNQLDAETPGFFPAPLLGNGQTLVAGVYEVAGAAALNLDLILDAENDADAVFVFQIEGPLSTNAGSKVKLINGAQACNVFWKVEGLVDMAAGTTMRGTVIANNAGINMNTNDTLEGRAMTTAGAITIDGTMAYTPSGCGSPVLSGPTAPEFGEAGCYGIFSSDGPVENAGITSVMGDVGANVGLTTGFDTLLVTGNVHPIPDNSTFMAAADLLVAYDYLNLLSADIELLYPAQFGGNLVLTPHTYVMNGAATFTDTLYLNAQGVSDAVFVIKIYGALTTSTFANVVLTNGAQAENVYWLVNGAVEINDYSEFNGTVVSMGAISLMTGATINGRVMTGVGALACNAITGNATIDIAECQTVVGEPDGLSETNVTQTVSIYPNPFNKVFSINVSTAGSQNLSLSVYNMLGSEVIRTPIGGNESMMIDAGNLSSGVYTYRVYSNEQSVQTGRLIAQ